MFEENTTYLPTLETSKQLLGMELVHETPDGVTVGRIVEVEAYKGPEDKAAHSYGGRKTERTKVLFDAPWKVYMFRIYGMHVCFNIVTASPGKPEAILVRALEPVEGLSLMAHRRNVSLEYDRSGRAKLSKLKRLTNGPGKLCQAMGLTMDHYGHDLRKPPLYLRKGKDIPSPLEIETGPRINIDYAEEAKHYPWRFWIKGNPFVSKG